MAVNETNIAIKKEKKKLEAERERQLALEVKNHWDQYEEELQQR